MKNIARLLIAYTLVGAFIFTVIITLISMVIPSTFVNAEHQEKLFYVLIVELVVGVVAYFFKWIAFNPSKLDLSYVDPSYFGLWVYHINAIQVKGGKENKISVMGLMEIQQNSKNGKTHTKSQIWYPDCQPTEINWEGFARDEVVFTSNNTLYLFFELDSKSDFTRGLNKPIKFKGLFRFSLIGDKNSISGTVDGLYPRISTGTFNGIRAKSPIWDEAMNQMYEEFGQK